MPLRQGRDTPDHHHELHSRFRWQVPAHFNMAQVCSRRWAADATHAQRTAVIATAPGQPDAAHSYTELQAQANRLSNALQALGVQRGDRVAIVMPQRFETAVAYMAVLQMGAVGMPLSQLFGPDALAFRLHDSEAVVALCDASTRAAVQAVSASCPALHSVIAVEAGEGALDWAAVLAQEPDQFRPVDTLADEAAVLIYTSGTTGNPKGALIPHRALIGNLTGFVCSQNWFGFDPWDASAPSNAVFWSPADWAWTGGLMDALLPTLYFGRPIVAHNGRFSPQTAFELMQRHGVTHTFLFPTALKAMMKACPAPREQFSLQLQAIMGRGGGRRGVRLLPRPAGRDRQRDVRSDRDQLHRGQLRHGMGRRSAGPPQARRHPRGGQRPAQRRSAGANRLACQGRQHGQGIPRPPGGGDR